MLRDGHRRPGRGPDRGVPGRRPPALLLLPVLLLGLLPGLVLGTAAPAAAHAVLRTTDPGDGTVLRTAPDHVTLTFTESVGLLTDSFRVYDPRNHRLRTGPAGHTPASPDTARVSLPAHLATGTYTVAWRVVSADSHPVSGALTFSVGERTAAPAAPPPDRAENQATTALDTIARYLAYLSLALLLGTAAFVAYCRPPVTAHLRAPALAAAATLALTTVALYVLRAPYEEAASPATAFRLSALTHTATTRPGRMLLFRLALLLVPAALAAAVPAPRRARLPRRAGLVAAGVLAVALCLTWPASDHASAGIQVPAALVSATLHLLATGAWLGGLAALLWTFRHTPAPAGLPASVPARFSRLAAGSVTVLVLTGVYQSWRGLGSWQALTGTTYGHTLLAKLAVVAALLLAAACSRAWTARLTRAAVPAPSPVPQPATGPPLPPPPPGPEPDGAVPLHLLRRSVLVEATAALLVLALTTLLTSTVPGRAETGSASSDAPVTAGIPAASVLTIPFDTGGPGGRGKVQITLDPGRVGTNSVQAVVYGADGGLSAVPGLRITLTFPSRHLGPLDTRVADRGGYWSAPSFTLPLPGTWTLKATVRVSDLDQVTVSAPLRVTR
ncbi:copper resistance protein CopC [Streptomyces sp. NPDC100445]|uniref:copper resistance CopC/CopD family protein n=1 Tax=Streptomyces sp. NPDC100445 TaxID=3366102 RepID=UPI00380D9BF4